MLLEKCSNDYNKFYSVAWLQVIISPNKIFIFSNENVIENYDLILLFLPQRHENNIKNKIISLLCSYLLFSKFYYKKVNCDKIKTFNLLVTTCQTL